MDLGALIVSRVLHCAPVPCDDWPSVDGKPVAPTDDLAHDDIRRDDVYEEALEILLERVVEAQGKVIDYAETPRENRALLLYIQAGYLYRKEVTDATAQAGSASSLPTPLPPGPFVVGS